MKSKKLFVSLLMLLGSINVLSACNSHTHHLKHIDKLDPTCVDDGHKDYYECEDENCGKLFSDSEGKNETTLDDLKLAKTGVHTGGTADCMHKAKCVVCGTEYGELGAHAYINEVVDAKYLKSAATCESAAIYYKSCICGKTDSDTFTSGNPLGHNYSADASNYKSLTCKNDSSHFGYIYEFEEARSNAWVGGEYNDKLWRIASSNKTGTSGAFYVGRVNDNSVDEALIGKTYLEFDVSSMKYQDATLNIRAALGTSEIFKKAFKVEVNGVEINVNDEKIHSEYGDWNHWEMYEYARISLLPGTNTIRFTIMESAVCDLDYAMVETKNKLEAHHLVIEHDSKEHWYKCSDEGCTETSDKVKHTFDQEVTTEEFKVDATHFYKSCICGEKGTETFEYVGPHVHDMKDLVNGDHDVLACDCGYMSRKFDLAASFSNSWSEGTEKVDKLWRQLGQLPGVLTSGNYVSHIGDVVDDGNHNDEYWIEIGVTFEGTKDIKVELSLFAGLPSAGSWSTINVKVNGEKIANDEAMNNAEGWTNFTSNTFGKITLKANQTNTIRISPNKGCLMNWCYLQIDSEIATNNGTQTLIDQAKNA